MAQSPHADHQGIMIVARTPILNVQPILPDLWTSTVIALLMHVDDPNSSNAAKLYVIGYYGKPDETEQQETLLKNFVDHIHLP